MKVTINGKETDVDEGIMVADVATQLAGPRRTGIAISLNGEIVPKSGWADAVIGEGDRLEVLSAIGGG